MSRAALVIFSFLFCISQQSISQCFTGAPTIAIGAVTASSISFSWDNVGGTSQRIKVTPLTGPQAGTPFSTITTNSFSYTISTGLTSGTLYKIEVWGHVVFCTGGFPIDSPIGQESIYTLALPPTGLGVANIGTSSFRATWAAATGASQGYLLDVSTNSGFSSFAGGYHDFSVPVNSTFVDITTLPQTGTTYYYRLRSKNSGGLSGYSQVISALTLPAAPVVNSPLEIMPNSFKASWQTSTGAAGYTLEVSPNNTFSPKDTYSILNGGLDNYQITNLNSGVTYFYRLLASNATGNSTLSPTASVITDFPAPLITVITIIDDNSIALNWSINTNVAGVNGYRLDVSNNNMFSSFVPGYENLLVTDQVKNIAGLDAGTNYYFRVRAVGASTTSPNSIVGSALTIPAAPSVSIQSITPTGFEANWNNVLSAASYRLDVSTNDSFTSFLNEYNNVTVPTNNLTITGLTPGTNYYCRVRSINSSGVSSNSTPVSSILTFPSTPFVFDKSNITSTGFVANWTAPRSATEYDLFIYRDQNFTDALEGYNPLVITHPTVTAEITGLTPSTTYFLRLRARNAPEAGSDFITISATTPPPGGSSNTNFSNVIYPSNFIPSENKEITAKVTGGVGGITVNLHHRANSELVYTKEEMPLINGTYMIALNDNWFDDFGMEFYLEAKDANQTQKDSPHTIVVGKGNVEIPLTSFGKELKNYHIVSVPYSLDDNHINNAFEKVMGAYNKKKWRLSQFNNDKLVDYENGLSANLISQGHGYWFVSKDEVALALGKGISYGNSLATPFKMQLKKGWNQIGNPFPYNLSWSEVMEVNGNLSTISALYVYNNENVSFVENDLLKVYGGGFVFADEATEINFPVVLSKQTGGRVAPSSSAELGPNDWMLPIQLRQGEVFNTESEIGMFENASDGKDTHDRIALPRFIRYVELNSWADSYSYNLSRNILKAKEKGTWNLQVESNSNEAVGIMWNSQQIKDRGGELLLHDKTNGALINMAAVDQYTTTPKAAITIYFNTDKTLSKTESIVFGKPYPNPFKDEVSIPIDYSVMGGSSAVIRIADMHGVILMEKEFHQDGTGLVLAKWNGTTAEGIVVNPGLYVYRIIATDGDGIGFNYTGKIIKQ